MQKQIVLVLCFIIAACFIAGCANTEQKQPAAEKNDNSQTEQDIPVPTKEEAGYAFGILMGSSLKASKITVSYDEVLKGIKEAMSNEKADIEGSQIILRRAAEEIYKNEEAAFLTNNAKKENIKITESGLQYEVLTEGTGKKPVETDIVKVHYKGTLIDGTVFDTSYERNEPASFPLNAVIPGWTEGLQLMSVGSKYIFYIPSKLAYGPQGARNIIPPHSPLIFEVELLEITEKPAEAESKPESNP